MTLLIGPANAQDDPLPETAGVDGLTMEVQTCFGSWIRQNCYFPLKVTIENSGRARRGRLRAVSQDPLRPLTAYFTAECDIPSNSRKTYYLYPYFLSSDPSPAIYVQYVERSPVIVEPVELDMLRESQRLWVEVADEGSDFVFVSGMSLPPGTSFSDVSRFAAEEFNPNSRHYGGYPSQQQPQDAAFEPAAPAMVWTRPENLPDRPEGYQSVAGLILNTRRFYELSPDQRTALADWIASGGLVIVWLGDDPARYQGSFLTGAVDGSNWAGPSAMNMQPVRTTLHALRTVPGLWGRADVPGEFPVTYSPEPTARTLLAEGDTPVLQLLSLGRGHILLSGLDLAALKSTSPTGLDSYVAFMMAYLMSADDRIQRLVRFELGPNWPGRFGSPSDNPFVERSLYRLLYEFDNVLQSDKLTSLPSLSAIALFLLIYIVLVGPVNYVVLLRMRRREWLWYTIPLVVGAFILGSYSWALGTKGTRLLLTRLNIVDAYPHQGTAWQSSYFGLYSPAGRRYRVALENENNLIRRLETPNREFGAYGMPEEPQAPEVLTLIQASETGHSFVEDAYIRIWSEMHFESEGAIDSPGLAWVDDVTVENNRIRGTLNVALNYEIESAFLLYPIQGRFSGQNVDINEGEPWRDCTVDFDLHLDMRSANPVSAGSRLGPSTKSVALREAARNAIANRNLSNSPADELILAAWRSGPTGRPLTNPRLRSGVEETLLIIHIPLTIDSSEFSVDNGSEHFLGIQAADLTVDPSGNLLLTDGVLLCSIAFPFDTRDGRPDSLTIDIGTGQAGRRVYMYSFDRISCDWVPLRQTGRSGDGLSFSLPDLLRHLAPDGRTVFLMIEGDPETVGDVISINDIDPNAS